MNMILYVVSRIHAVVMILLCKPASLLQDDELGMKVLFAVDSGAIIQNAEVNGTPLTEQARFRVLGQEFAILSGNNSVNSKTR